MSASPSDVAKAIEAQNMMAAASCAFNAGVVGTGKPLTVSQEKNKEKPKMRAGPTLAPKKLAKVSDIF